MTVIMGIGWLPSAYFPTLIKHGNEKIALTKNS